MHSIVAVSPDDSLKILRARGLPLHDVLEPLPKLPYVVYLYPGYNEIKTASHDWGFIYDRALNLVHLHQSGMMIPLPGSPFARQIKGMRGTN